MIKAIKISLSTIVLAGLLAFSTSLMAQQTTLVVEENDKARYVFPVDPLKGFYDQSRQGWFSFEDTHMQLKPDERKSDGKAEAGSGPPPFSNKWFRQNMQTLQDRAIDNPTEANVRIYLIVQRVMLDKAERFAQVASKISFGDPLLDESRRRSNSGAGMIQVDMEVRQAVDRTLEQIAPHGGLYLFTKANCQLCDKQENLLKLLKQKYGLTYILVSLDGSKLDSDEYLINNGQASAMGIDRAPSVVFYGKGDFFRTISQNAITLPELRERVLIASTEAGIISDAEFASTRNIKPTEDLSEMLAGSPVDPMVNPKAFLSQFSRGYRSSSARLTSAPLLSQEKP